MFIAVSKTVGFDTKQQEEINNAFKAVDDLISNTKVEGYEQVLAKTNISIIGAEENWSSQLGDHQINLLFKLPAHSAITINKSIKQLAKEYGTESTTTTGNTKLYYLTDHNIVFTSKRVRAVQYQTNTIAGGFVYYIDNSYDRIANTNTVYPWTQEDYDLSKLNCKTPMSNITIKLAREDNNYSSKYYYAKVYTNGEIRIMDSCEVPLYFNLMYVVP